MRRVFLHCNRFMGAVLQIWRNRVAMYFRATVAPFETTPCFACKPCIYRRKTSLEITRFMSRAPQSSAAVRTVLVRIHAKIILRRVLKKGIDCGFMTKLRRQFGKNCARRHT
jgi:hypothetical protein